MNLNDFTEHEYWSFEGKLNRMSRIQKPDDESVLAENVDIFDPIEGKIYRGYKRSFVVGSTEQSFTTNKNPTYFHVHNIIIPMSFELKAADMKVNGYPLMIQGEDFNEVGIFLTGITINRDPAMMNSLCTLVLYKMNNLSFSELVDDYMKRVHGLDK